MQILPPALRPLRAYDQFVLYKVVPSQARPGKTDKLPLNRAGQVANAHDPAIWLDVQTAADLAAKFGPDHDVGFVFTAADPFWFVDIDHCVTAAGWSPVAVQLLSLLNGAAVEISQSGQGLHIIGSGRAPTHGCKNTALGLEFYTEGRFVALTGRETGGSAAADLTAVLPDLVAHYFTGGAATVSGEWTEAPVPEWRGPTDDEALIAWMLRAQSARSVFGNTASFTDLWTGNIESLSRAYPDPSGARPYDASSADAALAQHLAFWTGKDCERMQRLMQRSALVRDKWQREDYMARTITGACARQTNVLVERPLVPPADRPVAHAAAPKATMREFEKSIASVDEQLRMFDGCVYITSQHKVLCPGGILLKPEQFKVVYGGYSFQMDPANERVSRDAFEAFSQSQAYRSPRADHTCFRPALPPATIIDDGGRTLANVWWPVEVPKQTGDIEPFMDHMRRVLPDERDRLILLSYMAACVQHKGIKFQWCPILQGVEGNGKTLFTRCVAETIGRRYVHMPKASKLGNQFNAYMRFRLFIGVEDIYTPSHRAEIVEELKDLITGEYQEIEGKGVDQSTDDVCANFLLNSNHKDGIRKTLNDRRYCPLFCAQQRVEHLTRDGMTGDYFPRLYAWLREGGYAIVAELLHTYPIPDEYNPATGAQRAPTTTSTTAMIAATLGTVEQEIIEAIEQGATGFAGGWVSSVYLDRLLVRLGAARRIPHNKRRELMQSIGYDWHPAFPGGRVRGVLMPDNGKPILFYRVGSGLERIEAAGEAAAAYTTAQMVVA